MNVRVVFSGRNYHLATSLPPEITLGDAAGVDDVLAMLADLLPQGERLPGSCLLAVSGVHLGTVAHHRPRELREGDEIVLVTPVAGG